MDRIGRDEDPDNRDRNRDRTRERKKRRFEGGRDPEEIKRELLSKRERNYERQEPAQSSQPASGTSSMLRKPASYSANDKHAKRAYIGNIPQDTDTVDLL